MTSTTTRRIGHTTGPRPPRTGRSATGARWAVLLSVLILAGVACGGGAQEPASDQVVSSDPELARLAAEILPGLTARSGLELHRPVRVERRSREQLEGYLRHKLDEELPVHEAEAAVEVYAFFGLVEPGLDLRALLLGLYGEQVAGFYEPDSTALFVLDDQPREVLESLLLHELVHAVQDQTVDLDALTSRDRGGDRAVAAHAAVEGHATLVMIEFMMERMTGRPVDLTEVPGLADQLIPGMDAMTAQFPALAGAPPVIQRALLFPYVQGAGFVQRLWAEEGRVAPFEAFLPESTEQILSGVLADGPVDLAVSLDGAETVYGDVLGRLELGVLVETHLGGAGRGLADGWGGDRYALLETADGGRGLVWVAVWDDQGARDRFAEGFGPALERLGAATLDTLEVDGLPGTVLRVGDTEGVRISARVAGGVQ